MTTAEPITLERAVSDAIARAERAERELEAAQAELEAVRGELLRLKQSIARNAAGILLEVWTPERIVEWAERKKDRTNEQGVV